MKEKGLFGALRGIATPKSGAATPRSFWPIRRMIKRIDQKSLVIVGLTMLLAGTWIGLTLSRFQPETRAWSPETSGGFAAIASAVEPSVVNISTVARPVNVIRGEDGASPEDRLTKLPPAATDQIRRGSGSGVIVDPRGYILTNNHVIAGAERIRVKLADGTDLRARLIGADRETDLAVVQVDPPRPLKAIRLGDSERMRVGDWVLAIGAPFGFEQTVTAGIISSTNRDSHDLYQRVGFQFFLQTDAAINRGNSGGPLINLSGEVIGINTAIATSTGDYNGICFALPAAEALQVYRQLISEGRVTRGFLGALTERVTPQIARVFGLATARGAIISNVSAEMEVDGIRVESPAARAGLRAQDIIINFNGESIVDDGDLVRKVAATRVGTLAPVRIIRNGQELTLTVTIGKRPVTTSAVEAPKNQRGEAQPLPSLPGSIRNPLGIRVESITPQVARQKGLSTLRGCLILRVEPGSVAEDAELRPGDVLEEINRQPIRDNDSLKRVLNLLRPGEPIVFQVYRENLDPVPRIFISLSKP